MTGVEAGPAATGGARGWVERRMPGLAMLLRYERHWLRHDVMAGLALTAVLVPVAIAYAVAAGLPAASGLHATVLGLAVYALFGPSRHLVLGPDSSLIALIAAVVLSLSGGDAGRALAVAGMLAVVSGLLCVAAGLARLGFVTELLSKPIRYGYLNGIALTVLVSQLPVLFGFAPEGSGFVARVVSFGSGLVEGRTQLPSLLLGLATLALIVGLRRYRRLPGLLLAVVMVTSASVLLELPAREGVRVVGPLPSGLPALQLPSVPLQDLGALLFGALAVALISFADTSVLSRSVAARSGARVDPDQELVALGAANVAAGLFQGFPISASATRTPVVAAAGARSQLAMLVSALALVLLLQVAPAAVAALPRPALAAVVIASALSLIEVLDLRRIRRIQPWEFWLSIGCLAGVAVLGVIPGIGLAIVAAVIEFLWNAWRPYFAVLGRVEGLKGFHDVSRHPQAQREPGLLLFRWDAPLFFANADLFTRRVREAAAAASAASVPVQWIVVGAEPVTSVDVTAADALAELDDALSQAGVTLCFAEMKGPVKDMLKRFGLFARIGPEHFFPTLESAVEAYRASRPAPSDGGRPAGA